MEVGEVIQNGGLVIGGAALTKIYDTLLAWWKTRQPVEVKQPIDVTGEINMRKDQKYVSTGEFNERMKKVDGDIAAVRNDVSMLRSDINNSNRAVIDKLDEIDKRSEDRAIALNRRIDPIIEKVAANSEAVDFIKKAAINATVGGKK